VQEKAAAQAPIGRGRAKTGSASHWMGSYEPKICLGNMRVAPI